MTKARTKKDNTRFYTVRKVRTSVDDLLDSVSDVRQRYVQKPMEQSVDFLRDASKNPGKVFTDIIDDSKDAVEDIRQDTEKKVRKIVTKGRAFITKTRKNPRKAATQMVDDGRDRMRSLQSEIRKKVEDAVESGREIVDGVEKDVRLVMDDGRKALDRIPGKETMEDNLKKGMRVLPSQLNLPARDDIEKMNRRVELLGRSVDNLNRQLAA